MKRSPQEKLVTLFDTAKKCLLILDRLFADLEQGAILASDSKNVQDREHIVIGLYISVLGLIDYFHRFYQIILAMPLLNKDLPQVKKLEKLITPVKDCRNYLQHMRGDLSKNEPITYPILGGISWIHDSINVTLLSQQTTAQFSVPGIAYDRLLGKYVCEYQLSVGGYEIQIDTVYSGIKSFWSWLDNVSSIDPAHIKEYKWGTPNITSSFVTKP